MVNLKFKYDYMTKPYQIRLYKDQKAKCIHYHCTKNALKLMTYKKWLAMDVALGVKVKRERGAIRRLKGRYRRKKPYFKKEKHLFRKGKKKGNGSAGKPKKGEVDLGEKASLS